MVYNVKILQFCALVGTGLQFYVYNLYLNTTNAQDDCRQEITSSTGFPS